MKTTCTLCWLLLFFLSARADNASLDQFQTQLKHALDAGNSDSIAAAYCRMSEYYVYRNSDSAHFFCKEGLKYADKNKPEPYLTLINNLADTYFSAGKWTSPPSSSFRQTKKRCASHTAACSACLSSHQPE